MIYNIGYNSKTLGYKTSKKGKYTKCYRAWINMLSRCYYEKQKYYKDYGKKGVKVCKKWHDFQFFAEFYYNNYFVGSHLDKDILGNGKLYSPNTCKFVTCKNNIEASKAKVYYFIDPLGKKIRIYNLAKFCRDKNLNHSNMCQVYKGKQSHSKGWTKGEVNNG